MYIQSILKQSALLQNNLKSKFDHDDQFFLKESQQTNIEGNGHIW